MERFIESKYLFESLRPYSLGVQICSVTTEQKSVAPLMCSSELDLKGSQIWPIARSEREQGQAHLAPQGTDPSLIREVGPGVKPVDVITCLYYPLVASPFHP